MSTLTRHRLADQCPPPAVGRTTQLTAASFTHHRIGVDHHNALAQSLCIFLKLSASAFNEVDLNILVGKLSGDRQPDGPYLNNADLSF